MRVLVQPRWNASYEFACDSKACAPPPVGTGGSVGGRGPRDARGHYPPGSHPRRKIVKAKSIHNVDNARLHESLDEVHESIHTKKGIAAWDNTRRSMVERGIKGKAIAAELRARGEGERDCPLCKPSAFTSVSGAKFFMVMKAVKEGSDRGAFLSLYKPKEYQQMHTVLAEDGKVGGALKDHGDGRKEIVSLFNNGGSRGAGGHVLNYLIAKGGNYLECYGEALRQIYEAKGFKVKESFDFDDAKAAKDWNYERDGRPRYYTMSLG